MSDLVERLRSSAYALPSEPHKESDEGWVPRNVCTEAADEIEQLRDPWISVGERLPDGKKVVARYLNQLGKERRVMARYVPRWTEEVDPDYADEYTNHEYSGEKDAYYYCAGWYEQIDNWNELSSCYIHEGKVTHWMPLPPGPGVSDE